MEGEKRKFELEKKDNEIVYSKAIKAGKRIYYLDVKRSRNNDLFLAITESKKKVNGFDENAEVSFEKHKIFLYREDFEKFTDVLNDVIGFIRKEQGADPLRPENHFYGNTEEAPEEPSAPREESGKSKGFFGFFK
jgi:CRISPR/Cas system CSM-associated protein Csm2 small subunit